MSVPMSPHFGVDRVVSPAELAKWLGEAAEYVIARPLEAILHDDVQQGLEALSHAVDTQQGLVACYYETGTPTPGPTDLAYQAQGVVDPGAVVVRHEHITYAELVQHGGELPHGAIGVSWGEGGQVKHCRAHAYDHARTRSWQPDVFGHVIYEDMLTPSDVLNCVACPRAVPGTL